MNSKSVSLILLILCFLNISLPQTASARNEVDLIPRCSIDDQARSINCDIRLNTKVPDDLLRLEEEQFSQVSVKWPDQPPQTLPLQRFADNEGSAAWLILIDQSLSLRQETIDAIKNDFTRVIESGKKGASDNIGIATFAEEFNLTAPIGSSDAELRDALNALSRVGNKTLLYASVQDAVAVLEEFEEADRKALVIVSDGQAEDFDPDAARFAAIRAAREANVVIYSVAYAQKPGAELAFAGMRDLAEKTGGPFRQADLSRILNGSDAQGGFSVLSETYADRFYEFLKNGGSVAFPLRTLTDSGVVQFTISSRLENVDWLPEMQQAVRLNYEGAFIAPPDAGVIARTIDYFSSPPGLYVLIVLVLLILALAGLAIYMLFFRPKETRGEMAPEEFGEAFVLPESLPTGNGIGLDGIPGDHGSHGETYGWLEVLKSGERIPLRQTGLRIGRHEDNDIRFSASTVHRRHAIVHMTPQRDFIITDLSGAEGNGVQVNSERIDKTELRDGDVIQFGEVEVKFHAATI